MAGNTDLAFMGNGGFCHVIVALALVTGLLGVAHSGVAQETRTECPPNSYWNSNSNTCHRSYADHQPPGTAPCRGGQMESQPNDDDWGWFPYGEGWIVWWTYYYWCHYAVEDRWEYWADLTVCEKDAGCDRGWFMDAAFCRSGSGYVRCEGNAAQRSQADEGVYLHPLAVHPPYLGLRKEGYPTKVCFGAEANAWGSLGIEYLGTSPGDVPHPCGMLGPADTAVGTLDSLLGTQWKLVGEVPDPDLDLERFCLDAERTTWDAVDRAWDETGLVWLGGPLPIPAVPCSVLGIV